MRTSLITQPFYCFIISAVFFLFANVALGQTLTSDRNDYTPGSTATFTGSGFQPGEDVQMIVHHTLAIPDTGADHEAWIVVADLEGNFVTTWHVCEDDCVGALLEASADGQSSGLHAEVFFADSQDEPPTCIVISFLGTDTTISFPAVPVFTPPTAIDACDSPVYIIVVSVDSIPGSFPGNYSKKVCWAATDGGGNESDTVCQTINVVSDTTATCTPPIVTASNNSPLCTGGTLNLSSTGGSALPGLTPDFGAAANFILFTPVGAVSNTGVSQITGNIGSNIGAITGFATSTVIGSFHNTDSVTAQCAADLTAAYNVLNNTASTNTSHAPAFGIGETLFAGVYSIAGAGSVGGNLTLDAQGDPNALFIFKIGAAFTTGASATIILANGATATNVFWVAEGAISMAAGTIMKGTLIANNGAISMGAGGSLEGRMFSTGGAVSIYEVTAFIPVNSNSFIATYTWTGPDGFTSTLQNPTISDINTSASGTYTVTVTNEPGCSSSSTTSVVIHPTYNITLAPVTSCANYTLSWGQIVSATGNYSHTYSSINGCDSAITIHVTINPGYNITGSPVTACVNYTLPWGVVAISSGDYSHSYSSVNGCDSVVTIHVTINPGYNITGSLVAACVNYTLPWGVVATSSGDYSHSYSSLNGCDSEVTIHVTINQNPYPTITGSNVFCDGSGSTFNAGSGYSSYAWSTGATTQTISVNTAGTYTVTVTNSNGCTGSTSRALTVNANPAPAITGSNVVCNGSGSTFNAGSGYSSYAWSTGATTQTISVNTAGTYTVTVTNSSGCTASTSRVLTVNANPAPAITGNNVVCNGLSSTFDAGSGYSSYVWSTGAITQTISVNTAGTYSVTVTNSNGCTGSTSRELTVNANPAPAITGNNSICNGAASILNAGSGYTSYMWSTGATTQTISVNTAGTYTVTVTNASGCTANATISVAAHTNPTATASSNSPVVGGNTLNLTSGGGTSYSWTGPNGFLSNLQNPSISSITYLAAGIYTVVVANSYGCTATATTTVVITCSGFKSYTISQGGWGTSPNGNNPAVYRNANFSAAFPSGLTMGCGSYWLTLTTSLAVQNFLPSGGTPAVLTQSYTNPTSLSNSFAGQITALVLNVGFDNYDAAFAPTPILLKDLYIKSGTFIGWTVLQVLNEAQKKFGGCSSAYTVAQLNTACTSINENYDSGTIDKGYLSCIPCRVANEPSVTAVNNLKLYPNPSNGVFVIELNLGEAVTATVNIQVLNLFGQIIYVNQTDAIDGILRQEVQFDNNMPNGNYLIRVISGQRLFTGQVVYQK